MDLACQYGPTDAHADLKPHLIRWHAAKDGVALKGDQIQVLNGAQEGLHTMAYLFLDRGGQRHPVGTRLPGGAGRLSRIHAALHSRSAGCTGDDHDGAGKDPGEEKSRGGSLPKFIYDVPNGNNPAGVSLSPERRSHLLQIASNYDLLILEDDPYQLVQLEDRDPLPTIQSLDPEERVVRLDSFSKIFAPGLRLGYASGPAEIIRYFQLYKQGSNLHTSAMDQALLAGFLAGHSPDEFRALIRENCKIYRRNRDAVLAAAKRRLPADIRCNVPRWGCSSGLKCPSGLTPIA